MKLDQLSSKPMTIERMTDFANTIILAYREDLYMYCLLTRDISAVFQAREKPNFPYLMM